MIIFGTKGEKLAQEILATTCPNCGSQNSIYMYVFQQYAHVFWIPFFPIKKTGISQCTECNQVLNPEGMPISLTYAYNELKAKTKTPFWMFSGMALLAVIMIIGVVSEKIRHNNTAQYILAPRHGDIFEIKTTWNTYTFFKVQQVNSDSVFVRFCNYETDRSTGIANLKREHGYDYSPEIFGIS
jgi:hypothetical protein